MTLKRTKPRKPAAPLNGLVAHLRRLGYKDEAEEMVLKAFKWKRHNLTHWIPPYNYHITFATADALDVCCQPCNLSDMASGRFDGITDGKRQVFTGNENKP